MVLSLVRTPWSSLTNTLCSQSLALEKLLKACSGSEVLDLKTLCEDRFSGKDTVWAFSDPSTK